MCFELTVELKKPEIALKCIIIQFLMFILQFLICLQTKRASNYIFYEQNHSCFPLSIEIQFVL
jgi:hypothetical protein